MFCFPALVTEIITDNLAVIKNKGMGKGGLSENAGMFGIIGCLQPALGFGNKNRCYRMMSGIAGWIRIGMKLLHQFHIQGCFLFGLPDGSIFQGFSVIDKAARQSPAIGRILSFDQDDAVIDFNNDVNGDQRVTIRRFLICVHFTHNAVSFDSPFEIFDQCCYNRIRPKTIKVSIIEGGVNRKKCGVRIGFMMEINSAKWKALVKEGAEALKITVNEKQTEQLAIHAAELLKWNRRMNITAITDPFEMAIKHYVDSMAPVHYIPSEAALLDIGSGGGFPGIVLKILMPSLRVVLIDASRKKVSFLKHVIRTLRLERIEAHHVRGEHLPDGRYAQKEFDVIISRAFAALDTFAAMALPLLKHDGMIIAMKGKEADQEMEALKRLTIQSGDGAVIDWKDFEIDLIKYRLPRLESKRSLFILKPKRK